MINSINSNAIHLNSLRAREAQNTTTSPITKSNVIPFQSAPISGDKLALALQAKTIVPMAKTISFSGTLFKEFRDASQQVAVCKSKNSDGENIGFKTNINNIINNFESELEKEGDAIKTTIEIKNDGKKITDARTQLKQLHGGKILFEMGIRETRDVTAPTPEGSRGIKDKLRVVIDPKANIEEEVSILNTKGKLMAVVESGDNVLLTNAGKILKRDSGSMLASGVKPGREFEPFTPKNVERPIDLKPTPSIGKGGELVIGMEQGRFNPEIVNSIVEFEEKIKDGEIVLPQFIAKPGADKIQIAMLAGGFGSRAEYTNASSSGIFHGKDGGAQSTKGVFRTATGLTPMETTFVSLHLAGLLDCSAENFGVGKNINFYLNKSGINKGNGGFSIDMYNKTIKNDQTSEFIFPNDSISRMPIAIGKVAELMDKGETAVAMIAKKVPAKEAEGTFGIMRLSDNNEIQEFAEKPSPIPEGFADEDSDCLTNTFQFAVSKEAFTALKMLEDFFSGALQGKETRDWSKQLIPTIMVLTQFDTPEEMIENLPKVAGQLDAHGNVKKGFINFLESVPAAALMEAKAVLHGQKVTAVPTDESWVDAGQAAAMYDVTMDIAKGDFKVEPFERWNVLHSINPKTGLVAMTPDQKAEIEDKYDIHGEVMAVPKAVKVDESILEEYADAITINPPQN